MTKYLYQQSLQTFSKIFFILTVLSSVVDPTNQVLHIKNISFVLFFVTSLAYSDFYYFNIIIIFLTCFFVSFAVQQFLSVKTDFSFAVSTLKTVVFLSIILWMKNGSYLKAFKVFYYSVLLMSIIEIVIWLLVYNNRILQALIYSYFNRKDNFVAISRRSFLGLKIFMVYYRTSVLASLGLSFSLYVYLFYKSKKYFLHFAIFFVCLIFSGTRANILVGLFLTCIIYLYYFFKKNKLLSFVTLLCIFCFISLMLIVMLLNEKGEVSLDIKYKHYLSYMAIFNENPLKYLFFGDGPGALFYTKAYNKLITQSELSYFDIIRNYGMIGSVLLLTCFFLPIYKYLTTQHKKDYNFAIIMGYIAYLFTVGTNPLLFSSTGIITLAILLYIEDNDIKKEMCII